VNRMIATESQSASDETAKSAAFPLRLPSYWRTALSCLVCLRDVLPCR
jgi:hypothetical protein